MMRSALLAAAAICCLAGGAQASVTYALTSQVYDASTSTYGQQLDLSLTISDAAVARGSFTLMNVGPNPGGLPGLAGNNGPNPSYVGDVSDFISFIINGEQATPDYLFGSLSLSATFNADQTVSRFSERFFGAYTSAELSGPQGSIAGRFEKDSAYCGGSACGILSSQLTQVPEPASMAILGIGLLAGMVVRRRA